MTPYVLGIAGGTASGKTYIARRIREFFPEEKSSLLELDSYYRSNSGLSFEERSRLNYDTPDALEFPLLINHLKQLKEGKDVHSPVYDFCTHLRTGGAELVPARPLIIVEGIFVLCDSELRALLDASVFVDTPVELCFERRMERDLRERGRTEESVRAQWESSVEPGYREHCLPSREHASLVIKGGFVNVEDLIVELNLPAIVTGNSRDAS